MSYSWKPILKVVYQTADILAKASPSSLDFVKGNDLYELRGSKQELGRSLTEVKRGEGKARDGSCNSIAKSPLDCLVFCSGFAICFSGALVPSTWPFKGAKMDICLDKTAARLDHSPGSPQMATQRVADDGGRPKQVTCHHGTYA